MSRDGKTELSIKDAAKKIFLRKGFSGARMQDIADEAGINKALLHYYFRSKEKIFDQVFQEALETFFPRIIEVINSDLPLFDKITVFVREYITTLTQHPYIPLFILHEISQDPQRLIQKLISMQNEFRPQKFIAQIQTEIKAGMIKSVSPVQFIINMLALCIFPIAGKPMIQGVLGLDEIQYRLLLEQRITEVPKLLIDSLKP